MRNRKLIIGIALALLLLVVLEQRALLMIVYVSAAIACFVVYTHITDRPKAVGPAPPPRPTGQQRKMQRKREVVYELTPEEAQRRAFEAIAAHADWERAPGADHRIPPDLPPSVTELFKKYTSINALTGPLKLDCQAIQPFEWHTPDVLSFGQEVGPQSVRFLQIGTDMENRPIVVRPGRAEIYIVNARGANPASWWSVNYPGIFHWLLMQELDDLG